MKAMRLLVLSALCAAAFAAKTADPCKAVTDGTTCKKGAFLTSGKCRWVGSKNACMCNKKGDPCVAKDAGGGEKPDGGGGEKPAEDNCAKQTKKKKCNEAADTCEWKRVDGNLACYSTAPPKPDPGTGGGDGTCGCGAQIEAAITALRKEFEQRLKDGVKQGVESGLAEFARNGKESYDADQKKVWEKLDEIEDRVKEHKYEDNHSGGGSSGGGGGGESTCAAFTDADLLEGRCQNEIRLSGTIGQAEREGVYKRGGYKNGFPLWERAHGGDGEPAAIWFEGNRGNGGDWGVSSAETNEQLAGNVKRNLVGITLRANGRWEEFTSFQKIDAEVLSCVESARGKDCDDNCVLEGACPRVAIHDLNGFTDGLEGSYKWDDDADAWLSLGGEGHGAIYKSEFGTWNIVRTDEADDLQKAKFDNLRQVTLDSAGNWAAATGENNWNDSDVRLSCEC